MLGKLESADSLASPAPLGATSPVAPVAPIAIGPAGFEAAGMEGAGSTIGRYKLLQVIGEGGFGVVYMAEQTEPVVRRVALKVIKLGMDTKEVVARFEAERQALALMDHPNIAKVLDGGATANGRPYFVMELVRGVSITEYCDKNNLSTRARLELFGAVCHAVQHAHQKGVIHRDIKPTNVMVTLHDGAPVPKIIDFGVAKAMHTRLTEKTLFTAYERFIGTPAYMSPEQAELSGLDIDTRTDIYSLGVLLYELLTGTTPFDSRALLEEGLAEVQRVIREEEPQRPSVRISTTNDATVATSRDTDVPALSKLIRGDLDWIVMKCLEKERVRRYDTASELAADVQRHLEDVPVLAGPPSAAYRMRKFLARNRAAAVSVTAVTLVLVGGIVGTTTSMVEAGRKRDEALASERRASTEAERARAVTDFLVATLSMADPEIALETEVTIRTLLDRASVQAAEVFDDQPRAEARVRGTIGKAYASLVEFEQAEAHLERAAELIEGLEDYDPGEHYEVLWTWTQVLFRLERTHALEVAQRARRVAHDYVRLSHPGLAGALDAFIAAIDDAAFAGRTERAADIPELFEASVRLAEASLLPGDPLWDVVPDSWMAAGFSLWYTPLEGLTVPFFAAVLDVQRRELPPGHPLVGETLGQLIGVLNRQGTPELAEPYLRDSLEEMRVALPEKNFQLAYLESLLGENLSMQGRFQEAREMLVTGHERIRAAIGDETNFYVADSYGRVIRLFDTWGRPEEGAPYRRALSEACERFEMVAVWDILRLCFGPEHAEVGRCMDRVQELVGGFGHLKSQVPVNEEELLPLFDDLLVSARAIPDDHPLAGVLGRVILGWVRTIEPGSANDACERMLAEVLRRLEPRVELAPYDVAEAHGLLSEFVHARGAPNLAARHGRLAWEAFRELPEGDNWLAAHAKVRLGRALVEQRLFAEGEEVLLEGYAAFQVQIGRQNPETLAVRESLAELYTAWGKPEEAARYRGE